MEFCLPEMWRKFIIFSKKTAGRFSAAFLRNIKSDELVWSRRRLPLDNEHLTNVASGDKAVFSELYDLTQTAVYGLALSLYEGGARRAGHHAGHLCPRLGIRRAVSSDRFGKVVDSDDM